MWAIGEPSGPIENGTTYIVRPSIEPRKRSVRISRISLGSRQLLVGPASSSRSEQMKVRSSTRATSPGSDRARYELGRLASERRSNVPASTSVWHSSSYSSADPSHQWIASGWVSEATSSTQARSLAWLVVAGVLCGTAVSLLTTRGTPPPRNSTTGEGAILPYRGTARRQMFSVEPDRDPPGSCGDRRKRLGARALAGGHRAVHVAAPDGRGLGPRPVQSAERRPQRRAEPGPRP